MKTSTLHPSLARSSPVTRKRGRAIDLRHVKDVGVALGFAGALFALIAFLDGVAQPDDISPGTAFAATPSAPVPAAAVETAAETWAADTSAQGTRPDSIH